MDLQFIEHNSTEYNATVELRREILRRPLGLDFTPEQLAAESTDYHLACYRDGELVGCLVLTPLQNGALKMRQVAVAASMQRQGVGRAMVEHSELFAAQNSFPEIVLHARDTAVPFYLGLDYEVYDEPFTEVGIPHRKMRKGIRNA